jgi:hypothetical protein
MGLENLGGQGGGAREGETTEWVEQGESGKAIFRYVRAIDLFGAPKGLRAFGPAAWKEKALRLRRHRLAEQEIRGRIDVVGTLQWIHVFDFLFLTIPLSQNILKDALGHWTNLVIAVKLRELEVVQQKNRTIVL